MHVGTVIPVLQMRTWMYREGKEFAQGHTTSKYRARTLNPESLLWNQSCQPLEMLSIIFLNAGVVLATEHQPLNPEFIQELFNVCFVGQTLTNAGE